MHLKHVRRITASQQTSAEVSLLTIRNPEPPLVVIRLQQVKCQAQITSYGTGTSAGRTPREY